MTFTSQSCDRSVSTSGLARWCKFNLVGGIGILVQFSVLAVLKSVMHFNYPAAIVIAVEAAVMHNFLWHEQFTWADRTNPARSVLRTSGNAAPNSSSALIAEPKHGTTQEPLGSRLRRLLRFHLGNGAVSILGNLALMKVMFGLGHMHYLVANAIAITVCSVANFLVSEAWVFRKE
jgi:putative flippase GtrA